MSVKKVFSIKNLALFLCALAIACIVVFSGVGLSSAPAHADMDGPATLEWKQKTITITIVTESGEQTVETTRGAHIARFYSAQTSGFIESGKNLAGETVQCNVQVADLGSSDWIQSFLSNGGTPLFRTTLELDMSYEYAQQGEASSTVYEYFDLTKDKLKNSSSLEEDSDGRAMIPVYSKNATGLTKPYGVLHSCLVSGKDYLGRTYDNVDIYTIDTPGLYRLASPLSSAIYIKYYFDYNGFTFTVTNTNDGAIRRTLPSGSIGDSDEAKLVPNDGEYMHLLLRSRLELYNVNNVFESYYSNNLGINAIYDSSDYRDRVILHSDSQTEGSFCFSTKENASYNVSNSDVRRFYPYSGLSSSGYPTVAEQETDIESGANSPSTNLTGAEEDLKLVWYEKVSDTVLRRLPDSEAVSFAADFLIKIESKVDFDFEVSPILTLLNGEEYRQPFTIKQRDLYIDVRGNAPIIVAESKEYDGDAGATKLFSNVNFSKDYWINDMNGIAGDYDKLSSFISGDGLFLFDGSVFSNSDIGTGKNVNIVINFVSVDDKEATKAMKGYNLVPRYYDEVDEAWYNCYRTGSAFELGERYAITANKIKIDLLPLLESEATPFNDITYGDVNTIGDFNLGPRMSATNTLINEGFLSPQYQTNWNIVYLNEGSVETDSQGRMILPEYSSLNTIYIIVRLSKRVTGDSYVFTDREGNKYASFSGKIYADEENDYYFIYSILVSYQEESASSALSLDLSESQGIVQIKQSRGSNITCLELDVGDVTSLTVHKKEVRFEVDLETEKDYDGTSEVFGFRCDPDGILSSDEAHLKLQASAKFAQPGAGDNVVILYDIGFVQKETSSLSEDLFDSILNSYRLNTAELVYDGVRHPTGINTGVIRRRDLTVEFYATDYVRKFDTFAYVAILVEEGNEEREDYYYFYLMNEAGGNGASGFAYESEIENMMGFTEGSIIIKLKLSGFLEGEGFHYGENDVSDFLLNKLSNDPSEYTASPLNTFELLSWVDTSVDPAVEIDRETPSSTDPSDLYRLEFYEDPTKDPDAYDRYRYVGNYRIVPKENDYAYLFIQKLDVDPTWISIAAQSGENYIEYNGQPNAHRMFENGKIDFSNHAEAAELNDLLGSTPETMIEIVHFESSDEVAHAVSQSDIDRFLVAGTYRVVLHVPSTTNYNSYDTPENEIVVNRKIVNVYVTFPWRVYGDPEIEYNDEVYLSESESINDHRVKANINHEVLADDDASGNWVYLYQKNIDCGNLILYSGFIDGETIGEGATEQKATVTIDLPTDAAGIHPGVVVPDGAVKNNYSFIYHDANLFVKRRPLEISSEPVQSKNYTGNQVVPDYVISGGPGVLAMYVVEYNGVAVLDEEGKEDETRTEVILSGVYKLKVYAKPDSSLGASSENYQVSEERLEVTLTVLRTRVEILDTVGVDAVEYSGDPYELKSFNAYTRGVSEGGDTIVSKYDWGTVAVKSFVIGGETKTDPALILDSGSYVLTLTATITDVDNVYFEKDGAEVYDYDFSVDLTILQSSRMAFSVTPAADQGIRLTDQDDELHSFTYTKVYDGQEATFLYALHAIGNDVSNGEINVVTVVDGVLFAVNQHVYTVDGGEYDAVAAAAIASKITGVDYDITHRNKMLNNGRYIVTFYVNNIESVDYDKNFSSIEYVVTFDISKRELLVHIGFEDGYGSYKVYRTPNSEIEAHSYMVYTGWVAGEDTDETVRGQMTDPTIDWSGVAEDAYVNGSYSIRAHGGVAPDNYEFDFSQSEREFVILRAESWIRVYGFYDPETDVYSDYTVYNGLSLEKELRNFGVDGAKVKVMRMSGADPVDVEQEDIGSDGISIRYVGRFIGSDKRNIGESDVERKSDGEVCKDVGEYVFAVSVVESANYNAVPERYYYLRIVPADLTISFVRLNEQYQVVTDRGYASKTYDKTSAYPEYAVQYSGFVGDDSEVYEYTSVYHVKHVSERTDASSPDVVGLQLYHPYYEIIESDAVVLPYDVDTYSARLVEGTGTAQNYLLKVAYRTEADETLYPVFEITPRPIDLVSGQTVIKVYDGNVRIPIGTITPINYVFLPCVDEFGEAILQSGPVEGDEIRLNFDYALSRFERKDVFDEYDVQSRIPIRIYGYSITNENYVLRISDLRNDEDGDFFYLSGQINPATAEIHFYDESDNAITTGYEVVYDARQHSIVVEVIGVRTDGGNTETVGYSVFYDCDETIYHKEEAPKNAQTYQVTVTIVEKNYVGDRYTLELTIKKAQVEVVFGGDNVQTYGSVLGGLTATAYGVEYESPLTVRYFDENDQEIRSIINANAGQYVARAEHSETLNFLYSVAEESFTILRRVIYPEMNVRSSYAYTGREVAVDASFFFNGVTYYPRLRFDLIEGNVNKAYNYGPDALSDKYPVEVGSYRVAPADDMQNFAMGETAWTDFVVTPVALTVKVTDLTLTVLADEHGVFYRNSSGRESIQISPEFALTGSVNGETLSKVFESLPTVTITDAGGKTLETLPREPGMYVMNASGGKCKNYVATYDYGILRLNKPTISQSTSEDADAPAVVVEGSFNADVSLVMRVASDVQYSRFLTVFDSFIAENEEFKGQNVFAVYDLRLSDGNVRPTDGGMMVVRLRLKDYFTTSESLDEPEKQYYVAKMSADGTVTLLEAEQDDEYLVFTTDSLETFAVLTDAPVVTSEKADLKWLIYVGIAAGVVLIGVAILIVKSRA